MDSNLVTVVSTFSTNPDNFNDPTAEKYQILFKIPKSTALFFGYYINIMESYENEQDLKLFTYNIYPTIIQKIINYVQSYQNNLDKHTIYYPPNNTFSKTIDHIVKLKYETVNNLTVPIYVRPYPVEREFNNKKYQVYLSNFSFDFFDHLINLDSNLSYHDIKKYNMIYLIKMIKAATFLQCDVVEQDATAYLSFFLGTLDKDLKSTTDVDLEMEKHLYDMELKFARENGQKITN